MKHVMVADATGNLAKKIVSDLLVENYKITAVSREKEDLNTLRTHADKKRLNLVACNIADEIEMFKLAETLDPIDVLVFISNALPPDPNDYEFCTNQVFMAINLISIFGDKIDHAIFGSSTDVYGNTVDKMATENHATLPTTYHGAGMLSSEKFWNLYAEQSGKPVTIFRFDRTATDVAEASQSVVSAIKSGKTGLFNIYPDKDK